MKFWEFKVELFLVQFLTAKQPVEFDLFSQFALYQPVGLAFGEIRLVLVFGCSTLGGKCVERGFL